MNYRLQGGQQAGQWITAPPAQGQAYTWNPRNRGGQALPQQANFQARRAISNQVGSLPGRMRPNAAIQAAQTMRAQPNQMAMQNANPNARFMPKPMTVPGPMPVPTVPDSTTPVPSVPVSQPRRQAYSNWLRG